jgi:HMG (high mobility group) box
LRSSENVAKTENNENNGAQKRIRYGPATSPYRYPHSHHHHHLPHSYYNHRYPPLRPPTRPLPLSQPPPDNLVKDAREHSSQQTEKSQDQQKPPKLPRSAFMCFKDSKEKETMAKQSNQDSEKNILEVFSREWRKLSAKERAYWEEQAREDKLRYVREKNDFKGTWNLPKKRAKKHPEAPKVRLMTGLIRISSRRRSESRFYFFHGSNQRPMSAFLNFSQKVRQQVKTENPELINTDVSRLLG